MKTDTLRLVLAVALSAAVLYVWTHYFYPPPKTPPAARPTAAAPVSPSAPAALTQPAVPSPALAAPVPGPAEPTGRLLTVDTPLYTATLSSVGPRITRLQLKKYPESLDPGSAGVDIISQTNHGAGVRFLWTPIAEPLDFTGPERPVRVGPGRAEVVEYRWQSSQGQALRLALEFDPQSYAIKARLIEAAGFAPGSGPSGLTLAAYSPTEAKSKSRTSYHRPAARLGDKVRREWKDLEKALTYEAQHHLGWIGFEELYFLQAFWPLSAPGPFGAKREGALGSVYVSSQPGPTGPAAVSIFLGPKDREILKSFDIHLEQVIDLGWFQVFAVPFYWMLKYLYKFGHNWGLAIIILTVLMRLVLFPINHLSYKSMKRMQDVQPLMNQLRERYKDKPDEMNKALFALYKTHKINPLSGCLPMVAQFPIFIALYNVLINAIELRHAPFYFWIHDLSSKDPYYVTPIIMGATMYIQQFMTPTTPDPRQKIMMYLMPAVFTFMFINFPSGLVIYWLISNVLGIAQQFLIYRKRTPVKA
ncbi:MAG: membrane protein insertase YidC [Nitrospirae bacterium]|nr:membrane protein insertase YidC [Nitrospirota bacterium]